MGQCQLCNCPKDNSESGQIMFPFFKNLTMFSDENYNNNNNLNLFSNTMEKNTIDQIKLTSTEKKRFEYIVRNSNVSREKQDINLREESQVSISNRLFINEIKEVPRKKYKIKKLLGVGSFGRVFLAQNLSTLEYIAMKEIPKTSEDLLTDSEIMDEIEILKNWIIRI